MRKSQRVMDYEAAQFPSRQTGEVLARWVLPALWASLALLAGQGLADALDGLSRAVQVVASTGLWLAWAVALGASLVPRTLSLTMVRIIMPAALAATAAAAWTELFAPPGSGSGGLDPGGAGGATVLAPVAGFGIAALVSVVVLSSCTGDLYVNGSSYGDERRMPLRAPGPLLIGPIPLAWLVCVTGTIGGPLLVASSHWIAGGAALIGGWSAAAFSARALHGLSTRWIVFVPAGVVLHDLMALAEPSLFLRRSVASMHPALVGTDATDLTSGSFGLAVQIDLTDPVGVTPAPRRTRPGQRPALESRDVVSVLFAPTRPGAVLREARGRGIDVGAGAGRRGG
jgi:hypothetical protein